MKDKCTNPITYLSLGGHRLSLALGEGDDHVVFGDVRSAAHQSCLSRLLDGLRGPIQHLRGLARGCKCECKEEDSSQCIHVEFGFGMILMWRDGTPLIGDFGETCNLEPNQRKDKKYLIIVAGIEKDTVSVNKRSLRANLLQDCLQNGRWLILDELLFAIGETDLKQTGWN